MLQTHFTSMSAHHYGTTLSPDQRASFPVHPTAMPLLPPSLPCPALCQLCNTTVPPTALAPSSLAPDVLHLEACSSPGCVGLATPLATNPASPQLYPVLGAWQDSKEGQPDNTVGLKRRSVAFDRSE